MGTVTPGGAGLMAVRPCRRFAGAAPAFGDREFGELVRLRPPASISAFGHSEAALIELAAVFSASFLEEMSG